MTDHFAKVLYTEETYHDAEKHIGLFLQRLYVGRKDIVNSSACLITPPQVNFLVNGKEVDRRVTVGFLDGGPQLPTDVTMLVKAGSNVLQVIGEFPGPYSIAVASTIRTALSTVNTQLQDYVLPSAKTAGLGEMVEADDEVVEGASRVSLRCPVRYFSV
jgi:E3 SUMO-protein ligase PIAS1